MTQGDTLDPDFAVARMVLVEIGIYERQLVHWMVEMEKVSTNIFYQIEIAWIEQYKSRIAALYNITRQPLLDNMTRYHMPLQACMMPELLELSSLPRPPIWFTNFAKESTTHALGFATSRIFPESSRMFESPSYAGMHKRNDMAAYFNAFSKNLCSLPDEKWFDQSLVYARQTSSEFPCLYCEVVLRRDVSTPVDVMDPLLDFFQVPDAPHPSKKTLARLAMALGEPDGQRYLKFARSFVQERGQHTQIEKTYGGFLRAPKLYRAAVLPHFAGFVADLVQTTGSIHEAAMGILGHPWRFTFHYGQPPDTGTMRFGADDHIRPRTVEPLIPVVKSKGCCGPLIVPEISADILAGCLWTIAAACHAEDVQWLLVLSSQALAEQDVTTFNRLVMTIGLIGTHEAIRGLTRLRTRTRHTTMLNRLDAAMANAAAVSGLTTVEAEEIVAPDHGLIGVFGRQEHVSDEIMAVLTIAGSGQGKIHYESPTGTPCRKLPSPIQKDAKCLSVLRKLRLDAKLISEEMRQHRLRLERSWLTKQNWSAAAFQERWLDHGMLGWLARRQIWTETTANDATRTCMFANNGSVIDPDGEPSPPLDPAAVLRLWHPIHATGSSLAARWRRTLTRLGIMQPIRQAWRETYVVTQAELQSSPDSRRYAFRVLHQFQAIELAQPRGWRVRTLVHHIPSSEGEPWMLVIPGFGVCAELRTAGVGAIELGRSGRGFTHVVTDRVQFRVVEDRGNWRYDGARKLHITDTPVRLGDVDPVVFSEVMRDIDLLISVAATTLDVGPEDLRFIPEIGEWRRQSGLGEIPLPSEPHFGGVARTRREVLETILPSLVPTGTVELREQHAIVHGRRHDYQIHLGSGEILVLPDHRQLVLSLRSPPDKPKPPRIILALHDDVRLHMIVDDLLMLVQDHLIRDESVLAQLEALARDESSLG
ncbi:DUF4132 domain-containing protein [Lichenicola cladoniae]|uniref:DUF4132 domain-containing protein n=1 Tax=Lichenicola cladoniae TaxID=1484109 RepID=A0A6M8HR32_9PROT|nr:DUF4132 domain-containing protein [Lichenicola cladoniae]NPD68841.1 DUF4132 domain-containing protein [Acetobacteraceae bacterium]QKE90740.1 DUF4132 domain-containing protein [Lichenicola cladoniae]